MPGTILLSYGKKIKELIPSKSSNIINDMTLDDDSMINEDKEFANHFNNFFVNIGESLISKFKQTDNIIT